MGLQNYSSNVLRITHLFRKLSKFSEALVRLLIHNDYFNTKMVRNYPWPTLFFPDGFMWTAHWQEQIYSYTFLVSMSQGVFKHLSNLCCVSKVTKKPLGHWPGMTNVFIKLYASIFAMYIYLFIHTWNHENNLHNFMHILMCVYTFSGQRSFCNVKFSDKLNS